MGCPVVACAHTCGLPGLLGPPRAADPRLNTGVARKVVGFGEDDLRALAGTRPFERGLGYLDAVSGLEVGEGSVTAVVHGTDVYEVEFTLGGDGLSR